MNEYTLLLENEFVFWNHQVAISNTNSPTRAKRFLVLCKRTLTKIRSV